MSEPGAVQSSGDAEPAWRANRLATVAGFVAGPCRIDDVERAALESVPA